MKVKYLVIGLSVLVLGLANTVIHLACKTTYKVYWNDKLPLECIMALNTVKSTQESESSEDKAVNVIPVDKCFRVLRQIRCTNRVYKGGIFKIDLNLKSAYSDCLSELGG